MAVPKRVFISYGTADAQHVATWLHGRLAARGYQVWRDQAELRDGEDWAERIEQELCGADAVVALLSPHAVRSGGECRNEIGLAKDQRKTIVPVMVRRCEPPLRIYELQRIDLEGFDLQQEDRFEDQLTRIVTAIEQGVPESPGMQLVRSALPRLDFGWMFSRHEGFVGREWLLDEFDRWLEHDASTALFLVGPAGVGKSAALCRWVQTRMDIGAVHFCRSDRADLRDPVKMVASIASQLVTIEHDLPDYATKILAPALEAARQPGSPDRAAELFDRLVCDPIRDIAGGRKWVLVVDALDEGGPAIAQLLADHAREGRLPEKLRLLVSSRPEPSLLGLFPNRKLIDAQGSENLKDLRVYSSARSLAISKRKRWGRERAERIAEQVAEVSGGLFSFAVSALDSLEAGSMSPADLDSLSPGIEALYLSVFSKLFPSTDEFDAVAGMLEIIVASPGPVTDAHIAAVLDLPQRTVSKELGKLGSLLRVVDGNRVPFHKSLTDWLRAGVGTQHPYGIEPLDGVRRLCKWHERSRDAASALVVADALIESRQARKAAEILRGVIEPGTGTSPEGLSVRVMVGLKLAKAERLATPGLGGMEAAVQVLDALLELPGLDVWAAEDSLIEGDAEGAKWWMDTFQPGAPAPQLSLVREVHESLAPLLFKLGRWSRAARSAGLAEGLRLIQNIPHSEEFARIERQSRIELARAEGRPTPWSPRAPVSESGTDRPLTRILRARGLAQSDVDLHLAEMLHEEWVMFETDRGSSAEPSAQELEEGTLSADASADPSRFVESVDTQFLRAVIRVSRTLATHAKSGSRIEVVSASTLDSIVGASIIARLIGSIQGNPSFRPKVVRLGDDGQNETGLDQEAAVRVLVGLPALHEGGTDGPLSFAICDGTCALRVLDGKDLGAGTESIGGASIVAGFLFLSAVVKGSAKDAAELLPDIAALTVLGGIDDAYGWKFVRYFYGLVLEGHAAGLSSNSADDARAEVRARLADFHRLMESFPRLNDLVRADEGMAVAELLCTHGLLSRWQTTWRSSGTVGVIAAALLRSDLLMEVPQQDGNGLRVDPGVLCPEDVLDTLEHASARQKVAIAVGALSAESDDLEFGMRAAGPGMMICHAACRRVRDLRRALEPLLGMHVDFLPTSLRERCDFLFASSDRELIVWKLRELSGTDPDTGCSRLDPLSTDLESERHIFDSLIDFRDLTRFVSDGSALFLPFTRQHPSPRFLLSGVSIVELVECAESDEWHGWGWVKVRRDVETSQILCALSAPAWLQLKDALKADSVSGTSTPLDLLLVPIPLAGSDELGAFEIQATRPNGSDLSDDDRQQIASSELLRQRINDVLSTLTYHEREIIKLRYGIGDGMAYTPEEVARIFKVSVERVLEIEDRAREKLRDPERRQRLQTAFDDNPDASDGEAGAS
jgi:RNA polymerase sigma factor (sigma-70 family)